ncbi:hypothetical protein DFP73DRAFT_604882 [Morchella snyderi]|nr:hypothetical protein DFP73DRAFT_604882 [Morchella snyderi]
MAPPSPQFSTHPENEILSTSSTPPSTISDQFPSASSPNFKDSSLHDSSTAAGIPSDTFPAPVIDNSLVRLPRMRAPPVTAQETPVRPSTSESNDEDGFSIITPDHYNEGYAGDGDGSGYRTRSLMDIVEDSFRPSLGGHRCSPEVSGFETDQQDDADDEALLSSSILSQISDLSASDLTASDLTASFFIAPIDGDNDDDGDGDDASSVSQTHPLRDEFWDNFRRSARLVPVLDYAPLHHIEENSCEGLRSSSVLEPALQRPPSPEGVGEKYGEASTIIQTTVLETKEDAASVAAVDGSGDHKSRAATVEYASEPESESGSSFKARSEFKGKSIPQIKKTDNAIQSNAAPPLPPHLRMNPGQPSSSARLTSESGEPSVSSRPVESTSEIDRETSIRELIDSIYIDEIALLATILYSIYTDTPENRVDCSVDPNPRIGSKNLLYTVKLSSNARFGEARPVKWLIRIPLSARNFSAADRYWLESDIKAMTFIKEKTDIPVPPIYSYDLYEDNCLGVPFILMDCMKGGKVDDLWCIWNDEEKMRCLSQCAEHMTKLGKFPFDKIGVIAIDYAQEKLIINGKPHQLNGGDAVISGPFTSTTSYLDHIWVREIKKVRGSTETEEVKARNLLLLLKLLTGALVEPVREMFYLSPPELGGGNVLVDFEGNVTAFVGWEQIGILPKDMGYARYPEWITEDWVHPMKSKPVSSESLNNSRCFRAAEASPSNEKTSEVVTTRNLDRLRKFVYLEYQDPLAYLSGEENHSSEEDGGGAADRRDAPATKPIDNKAIPDLIGEGAGPSDVAGPSEASGPPEASGPSMKTAQKLEKPDEIPKYTGFEYDGTPHEYEKWKYRKTENGGSRCYGGMRYRNKRGYTTRQHNRNRKCFDEAAELQKATTSEEKAKVHKLSQWNSLSYQLVEKDAQAREERKREWNSKKESEKKAAIEQASVIPPVLETFKKVFVGPGQVRKLVEVTRTYRDEEASTFADEMARFRDIYDGFVFELSPEDLQATRSSLVSASLYAALKNDAARSHIVPKLAKEVFGNNVGPNILTMVGNGPWAQKLLAKLDDYTSTSGSPEPENSKPQEGKTIYIYCLELVAIFVIVVVFFVAVWLISLKSANPNELTQLEKLLMVISAFFFIMTACLLVVISYCLLSGESRENREDQE